MRTKTNHKGKPAFILSSDWHLREDVPICRKDDFYESQWKDVDHVSYLQRMWNIPVILPGDLFDHWKPSPKLLSDTMRHIPKKLYAVYGNHDVPQHNLDLAEKCGMFTLVTSGHVNLLNDTDTEFVVAQDGLKPCYTIGSSWNELPTTDDFTYGMSMLAWHVEVYQGTNPYVNGKPSRAAQLLKDYPNFDLIVTGDNHIPFVEYYDGRLLVNPGSLNVQSTSETHKPRVYLYYPESHTVEAVYLPQDHVKVSDAHLIVKKDRDSRIDAFISGLNDDYDIGTSFEDNLEKYVELNKIENEVNNIIIKSLEHDIK